MIELSDAKYLVLDDINYVYGIRSRINVHAPLTK